MCPSETEGRSTGGAKPAHPHITVHLGRTAGHKKKMIGPRANPNSSHPRYAYGVS